MNPDKLYLIERELILHIKQQFESSRTVGSDVDEAMIETLEYFFENPDSCETAKFVFSKKLRKARQKRLRFGIESVKIPQCVLVR